PAPLPSARELLLSSFERYLLVERGLAAGTVAGYLAHAGRFLAGLPAGGLPEISAAEVSQAVLRVSLGGGRHCAELHFRAAGLPRLLVPRGLCWGGPLAGGSCRAAPAVVASPRARQVRDPGHLEQLRSPQRAWSPGLR